MYSTEWGGDIIVFTIRLCIPQSEEETSLCSLSVYVLHRVRRRHHCFHYQSMYSTEWGGDIIVFTISLCTPQSEEGTSLCSLSVYVLHRVRRRHHCVHYRVRRRHHCVHYQSRYSREWRGDIIVFTISLCTPQSEGETSLCSLQSEEETSLCSLSVYVLHRVRRRHHCVHYQSMYSTEWGGDIIVFTISLCAP